jgi:putative membrane-bound dehydrogenase-like protein
MIRAVLISILCASNLFGMEVDSRMVPPADAIQGKLPATPPTSASDAAKTFRVLDGFRMDLLAAEPLLSSPVAMAYDENGRAYVCEMRDYPYTDKAHHQRNQENPTDAAIGAMRLLEDTDGDGVFDKSTVFAENLSWPTGVACWKGGVFVAATPDIWYLKDTDGDGKADVRRKVFSGFRKLNVQSVMNNLVWGLDNHIHGAGGSNGGQIRPAHKPDAKPIAMGRHDFRIDPLTEDFELLSGGARFGGTFDDWGHRFLCDIRNPAQHVVLPLRYLARNPFLAARSALHDMAESGDQLPVHRISEPEFWRVLRARRWSGERDIVMPRSELVGAGVVTSSSGITSYRGDAYREKYRDNVFVCEVAGNLLYRLELTADGPTFKATRPDQKGEMVASTDNWFRPVNFVNAPDGALHVVDMYRENIEHPWSIPDDIHAAVDLERGRERGRLWRLTPPNFKSPKPPRLGSATTLQLVATLENPNSWWRETAQRLLVERHDQSSVSALRQMARSSRIPQARLHALWTLAGLKKLEDDDIVAGLRDAEPGVRENAIKLAESRPPSDVLFGLASDPDAGVRLQLAFTLGEIRDPKALDALAVIARADGANSWFRAAILSSVATTSDQLLTKIFANESAYSPDLIRELGRIVGSRGQLQEMQCVIAAATPTLRDVVTGIGEGLKRSGKTLTGPAWDTPTTHSIYALLSQAAQTAAEPTAATDLRGAGIRLLALDDFARVKEPLSSLLDPKQPQEIQLAAVAAIASFNSAEIAPLLLSRWATATPAVRAEIVNVMLGGRNGALPLLQAIDQSSIPANQIPFARRAALQRSGDPQVKNLAAKIFGDSAPRSKKETLANYQASLSMKGDAGRGKKVFEAACATCHRAGDIGRDVGPNLATIRQWNPEQILINILDPNREVASNFLSYSVETKDGRNFEGIIVTDAAAGVTIQRADAVTETILRRDIAQISGSGLSLMPDGLEAAVSVDQMADLIAFLRASP